LDLVVRSCDDAQSAHELAANAEGILCDVHLGDEHGPDIVRELRRRGIQAPILMLTSDATRATVVESIQAGITDYVLKPIDAQSLIEKVTRHGAVRQGLRERSEGASASATACLPAAS